MSKLDDILDIDMHGDSDLVKAQIKALVLELGRDLAVEHMDGSETIDLGKFEARVEAL